MAIWLPKSELVPKDWLTPEARIFVPKYGRFVDVTSPRNRSVTLSGATMSVFNGLVVASFNGISSYAEVALQSETSILPSTIFFVGYTGDGTIDQTCVDLSSSVGGYVSSGFSYQYTQCMRSNLAGTFTSGLQGGNTPYNVMYSQAASFSLGSGPALVRRLASRSNGYSGNPYTWGAGTYGTTTLTGATFTIGKDLNSRYLYGGIALAGFVPGKAWEKEQLDWFAVNMIQRLRDFSANAEPGFLL